MLTYRDMQTEAEAKQRGRDHVNIRFSNGKGAAFRGLGKTQIYLIRCPKEDCGSENYALNVSSGICSTCGFDVSKDAEKETES
jgi:ribosomal protein L37E